jgi:hypothetical protein
MFPMWIIVAAVAAIVVVAATVVLFRRPSGSDLSSVKRYHSALGTMEHLSDGQGQTVGKVTAPPGRPGVAVETGRSVPPVPVRGTDEFPDPEGPIVFDDSRPHDRYRPSERFDPDHPRFAPSRNRAERNALESMNRRPRRSAAVIAAVIVVALVGVLILIGSHKPKPAAARRSDGNGSGSHNQTTGGGHGTTGGRKDHHTQVTAPPPPTNQVVALTSTRLSATYPASGSSYQVTVTSTGPCWVQATSATGTVIWTGTMQAGQTQQIPATGVTAVELGSATCSMKLDSVPVVFPTPMGTPFTATFQPGGASTAGTTATTVPPAVTSPTSTTVPVTTGSTSPSSSVP